MRLFELNTSPLAVSLVSATNQLKSDIDAGKEKPDWTLDELLQYYQDSGIVLDRTDLYDAIKQFPMKKYIKNIQGQKVVFKGQDDYQQMPDNKKQDVVAQMAKDAMK
jgi:hypothetical protein